MHAAQGGIDIFAVAAALGEGATRAVDEVTTEFVPRPAFVEEVQKLLEGAEERSEVLQMQLEQREVRFLSNAPGGPIYRSRRYDMVVLWNKCCYSGQHPDDENGCRHRFNIQRGLILSATVPYSRHGMRRGMAPGSSC